jgi:hypothetical protein
MGWVEFKRLIEAKNTFSHLIRIAYHQNPEGELIFTDKGNIIVRTGKIGYRTSDGKFHSI